MKATRIVYDQNEQAAGIAIFDESGLMEIDICDTKRALEGNVFLARIDKKVKLANDKYAFLVDIGEKTEAFLSTYEPVLKEAKYEIKKPKDKVWLFRLLKKNARKRVLKLCVTFKLPVLMWFIVRLSGM